jgi:predicted secreted protein
MMRRIALLMPLLFAVPARAETILKLAETATVMVAPDELDGELRAIAVTSTAAEAQSRVNAMIAAALASAKDAQGVQVSTGAYTVWRNFENKSDKTERWQASQAILLKGGDGAAVLKVVGALQADGLAVSRLDWQLAPETARRARATATESAIRNLRARADAAATLLDLTFGEFREVRLDNVRPQAPLPRAMLAAAAPASASAPPPSAEPEEVEVSATAEADIALKPR